MNNRLYIINSLRDNLCSFIESQVIQTHTFHSDDLKKKKEIKRRK